MRLPSWLRSLRQLTPGQQGVILLAALALVLGLANFGRALVALHYRCRLPELSKTVSLDYLAAMGSTWGLLFTVSSAGLWRFHDWGRRLTLAVVTLYQVNVWINRLLFAVSDYSRLTRPRDLLLSAIVLLAFWGSLMAPSIRRVFADREKSA